MSRMKENPRYKVISMRISEKEFRHLEYLMEMTHNSISHIMREAMNILEITATPKILKTSE